MAAGNETHTDEKRPMSDAVWYYADQGQSVGPMTLAELVRRIAGTSGDQTLVYGPGTPQWTEARHVAAVASFRRATVAPPTPPKSQRADEIDYEIFGHEMQYVEITLDPNEMVVAEAGAMMYIEQGIHIETVFGDPAAKEGGFWSKMVAAGKRVATGESLFMTTFENRAGSRQKVAFASPYPGKVLAMHLDKLGGELICQKDAFICAARGIKMGIAFQRRLGAGLFGGEGFIMQRLNGDGIAMIHAGGTLLERQLAAGETLKIDTGCLVAMTPSIKYDIEMVKGVKNIFFGGEGLFLATLVGPGHVWLQSLPFSRLAGRIHAAIPRIGSGGREEGSVLGGLGRLLDGDNS